MKLVRPKAVIVTLRRKSIRRRFWREWWALAQLQFLRWRVYPQHTAPAGVLWLPGFRTIETDRQPEIEVTFFGDFDPKAMRAIRNDVMRAVIIDSRETVSVFWRTHRSLKSL